VDERRSFAQGRSGLPRHSSHVAQLFSLGIMRARHYQLLGLVFLIHWILVAVAVLCGDRFLNILAAIFAFSSLTVPLIGYMIIFSDAPMFARFSPYPKMACIAFTSVMGEALGFFITERYVSLSLALVGIHLTD